MMARLVVVVTDIALAAAASALLREHRSEVKVLQSLEHLKPPQGQTPDLLIFSVGANRGGWHIPDELKALEYSGPTIAVVDTLTDPRVEFLRAVAGVHVVPREQFRDALHDVAMRLLRGGPVANHAEGSGPAIPAYHGIVAASAVMRQMFARIEKLAATDANVCIYGESGTGKELVARAIHEVSPRRNNRHVTLDCTTIPEGLLESQLLGHVKGAFTGAVDDRDGVFSLAHGGTLFMDEITELHLPLQAKLLRVVQTREFTPVGGTKSIKTDVRLVTATNRNPKVAVEQGRFREDLYYRISVFMITVPPLRERVEDIPVLAEYFLTRFAARYGKPRLVIDPAAMRRMTMHSWPGNVRELENLMEQAVVMADGPTLTVHDLFPSSHATVADHAAESVWPPLREVERSHVLGTLRKVRGNRTEAARLLGISLRGLQYKLKTYALPSGETP